MTIKVETRKIVCKECRQEKIWKLDGLFDGKNKRWINDDGLLCNGVKHCGVCNKNRVKQKMQKLRAARKEVKELEGSENA